MRIEIGEKSKRYYNWDERKYVVEPLATLIYSPHKFSIGYLSEIRKEYELAKQKK